jgi:hypothetical protein
MGWRAVIGIVAVTLCRGVCADTEPKTAWLSGRDLQARFETVVPRVVWSGVPLRQVIRTVSTTQAVAILLDRRVDPDHTIDLTLTNVTVAELLQRIAKARELGLTRVGPVTYLGPPAVTARLRTLASLREEDVEKLPPDAAATLLEPETLAWNDFATPRGLLSRLTESAGIRLEGLEQVPHDLWAAADLPSLPLVDRLTLIAVQFDLTFRIGADGRSMNLVPVPERVAVVRRYPGGREPQQLAQRWSRLVPESQVRVVGDEVFVRGSVEDHERLNVAPHASARPAPRRPSPSGRQEVRFTVQNTKGPLDRLVAELGQKLKVEVRLDRDALEQAGISPNQMVSFSVKEATVDELFEAVLSPAGCTFRREGKTIVVVPADR